METDKKEIEKHKHKSKPGQNRKFLPAFMYNVFFQKALILIGVSLAIAILIAPSFTIIRRPYQLGDIADQNIKAKRDMFVEDAAATVKRREEVARLSPPVYDMDENLVQQILDRLDTAFQFMRDYLSDHSRFGVDPNSQTTQSSEATELFSPSISFPSINLLDSRQLAFQRKQGFESLLGFEVSDEIFLNLLKREFGRDIQDKIAQLLKSAFEQGIVSNKAWLAHSPGNNILIRKLGSQEERLLPPPYAFPNMKEARKFIRMQAVEQWRNAEETITITFLVSQLLQPNLTFNFKETEERRERAYASVKPVMIQAMQNEMLVREGQRIGREELLKLKDHDEGKTNRHWFLIFTTIFLSSGLCIWVVVHVVRQHIPSFRMEVQDFLFLGLLLVILLALGRSTMSISDILGEGPAHLTGKTLIYAIPLSAGAMMASIFFGVTISLIFSLLLTLFAGMLLGKDLGLFFYFLIGSYVAAHGVVPCRNRMVPIRAGLLVGCANVILVVLNALVQDQLIFFGIVTNAFFGLCGGIFAGILATGFSPLIEMVFSYTTDIKLMELVTMDQPLLQELMVQAPGTYHHSIIVGNMVEASGKSIGANALLAKVAAYYHDIGKIKKPLYFIENQFDCENRHEKLAPSMSSLILISHVKEGVELARQRRLPKVIIDIIGQHHGKSLISFFYQKAMEAREKVLSTKGSLLPPINIDDYRYPGPKPQTKEAGLVMLADVVEAACRSLSEPTPARIQGMVSRLINNIFSDGQLEECELTLKDLHHIAKHFNQILATVHHTRIEYPTVSVNDGKGKADVSDPGQRESKSDRDKSAANQGSGKTNLKRLGIH